MKRSTLYGAFLTLLMFWLVILAVVVFLFQARNNLNQELATVNDEKNGLDEAVAARDSQIATVQSSQALTVQELATREIALGEAQARQAELEGELNAGQSANATLAAEATSAAAAASAAEATLTSWQERLPEVRIITPTTSTDIRPDTETVIIISATDPDGLKTIALSINGEQQDFAADGATLMTITVPWIPADVGSYQIVASAVDQSDQTGETVLDIEIIDVEAQNAAIRAQVEANVMEIRGLQPNTPILPTLLTREELAQRVEEDFFGDYSEADAADDTIIYCAFDFVACDYDLYNLLIEVYSGAIAGFYDPETAEFVVVSDGGVLTASEQWTHAHEFMHALQDQYFGLDRLSDDSMDSEAVAAFRALAEGEASLVQILYLSYFTPEEQASLFDSAGDPDPFDGVPTFVQQQVLFPYEEGLTFVQNLYNEGGFELIDEVWADPPVSTEQILHPELYLAGDEPIPVPLPALTATLGTGWRQIDEEIVGEFMLRQYLAEGINYSQASDAAAGWGGDRFAVYYNDAEAELVLTLRTVWDSPAENDEFQTAYQLYGAAQYGNPLATDEFPGAIACWQPEGELVCLLAEDEITSTVLRAPSLTLMQQIWAELTSVSFASQGAIPS